TGPTGAVWVLEDDGGKIWYSPTTVQPETGVLCEIQDGRTRCYGAADGLPSFKEGGVMTTDREGNIWVGSEGDSAVLRWGRGSHTVYPLPRPVSRGRGIKAIAALPDGTILVAIGTSGPRFGLQRLVEGRWQSFKVPGFDGSAHPVATLFVDREGTL